METFLLAVGYWNLIGSLVLYLMLKPTLADKILRLWTGIIAQPYEIGKYGALWLLWAATTNTFLGVINIFAAQWEFTSQTIIIYADLFVYGVFLISAIAALKNVNYGKGHFLNILLFLLWILWATYSLHLAAYDTASVDCP